MRLYPNLTFDGQCEAAFKFYEECLHSRTVFMMTYEDTPMDLQTPSDWQKKINHATFAHANFTFYGSDAPPGRYQKPQGFALQFDLVIQWKPSASSTPWQKTELFKCRCRRHFGRLVSAFWLMTLRNEPQKTSGR